MEGTAFCAVRRPHTLWKSRVWSRRLERQRGRQGGNQRRSISNLPGSLWAELGRRVREAGQEAGGEEVRGECRAVHRPTHHRHDGERARVHCLAFEPVFRVTAAQPQYPAPPGTQSQLLHQAHTKHSGWCVDRGCKRAGTSLCTHKTFTKGRSILVARLKMDLPFHNRLAFTGEVPAVFPGGSPLEVVPSRVVLRPLKSLDLATQRQLVIRSHVSPGHAPAVTTAGDQGHNVGGFIFAAWTTITS